jgi:hypothetical protein
MDYQEPSLVYYGGPVWDFSGGQEGWEGFLHKARQGPAAVALVQERRIKDWAAELAPQWVKGRPRQPLLPEDWRAQAEAAGLEILLVQGINPARASWVEVAAFRPAANAEVPRSGSGTIR